jgi:hypothetical protein
MQTNTSEAYVQQLSDIARKLPEEKLIKVLSFAQKLKEEPQREAYLRPKEILALAHERAAVLRRESRFVVETQYQELLKALRADIESKDFLVDDFPLGD